MTSTISYKVYNLNNLTTSLGTLSAWFDESSVDTFNEVGHGSLKLANNDPQLALCTRGRVIRKIVDATAVFEWIIDRHVRHTAAPGEEVDEYTEISGDGIGQVLNRAVVKPTLGYEHKPWGPTRIFSFASPEYDVSTWPTASAIVTNQATPSTFYTGLPAGWVTPAAVPIGPVDGNDAQAYAGNWYVVGEHTLPDDIYLVLMAAADNKAVVYGNGFELTKFGPDRAFTDTHTAVTFASAGTVRFGAKISNMAYAAPDPGPGRGALMVGDPTMFLAAVYWVDKNGAYGLAIQTDTNWKILAYPATPPGWTVGGVMVQLLTEAQADGLLPGLTWDFDAVNDSAGRPWDVQETISLTVGDDYLSVLRAFGQVYCDWDFGPTNQVLSMWKFRTRGAFTDVAYIKGVNVASISHDTLDVGTDALLVSYAGGQFRYPATGGTRVASFVVGNAATKVEATQLAAQQLALLGGTITQVSADILPTSTLDQPYTGAFVGDMVQIVNELGVSVSQRIMQVTGTTDPEGNPVWSALFRDIHLDASERLAQVIKRMSPGGLGGNSTVASPNAKSGSETTSSSTTSRFSLAGTIDGITAKIVVLPDGGDLMSGIIVKAPSATWGGYAAGGSADYGKGQFISFHRYVAGLADNPNNSLMFRVDGTGGMGLTGAVHIATGLRQAGGYSATQAVWIQPSIDTNHIVMTGVAGQTLSFLLATTSVGGQLFKVFNNGAIQSAAEIAARTGLSTQVAMGDVAGFPSIQFGNDSTTFLARGSVAGRVKATSYMDAAKDVTAWIGDTNKQVLIGDVFGIAGIGFGSALDAIAYRGTVAGQVAVSNGLAVINAGTTANQLLTLKGVSGQTGKAIQYVNSVGTEIWSVSAAGVMSPAGSSPDPISITGNVTAHNADAQLTQIGSIFGSSGIGMGSSADAILVRTGAGAMQMSDSLTVQNVSHSSANVIAAIGASGQSGYLFVGVTSVGGTVFGVTVGGAVSAVSASLGAISGSSLNVSGAIIGGATSVGAITASGLDVGTGVISGQYLRGPAGGNACNLTTSDGGHNVYFHWNAGTNKLECYIDGAAALSWRYGTDLNTSITGTSAKAFVIDHPVDDERWLIHACLEGPTADVYYRGRGKLFCGIMVIELPGYFEALTHVEGRTVQVTPLARHAGERVPHLHATYPVEGRFEVGADDPVSNAEFFWEVKATRRDVARLNVEPLKADVVVKGMGPYRFYENMA